MTFGVELCQKEFWTSKHNSSLCFSRPISTSSRNANRWSVQFHVLFSESVLCFGQLIRLYKVPADTTFLVSIPPKWLLNVSLREWVGFLCGQKTRHVRPWARASVEGKLSFLATEIWLPSLIATSPFPPDGPGVEGHGLSLTCLFPWWLRNLPASLLPKYGSHCPYSGIKKPLYRWFWKAFQRVPILAYLVGFFVFFLCCRLFFSLCAHCFLGSKLCPLPQGTLILTN